MLSMQAGFALLEAGSVRDTTVANMCVWNSFPFSLLPPRPFPIPRTKKEKKITNPPLSNILPSTIPSTFFPSPSPDATNPHPFPSLRPPLHSMMKNIMDAAFGACIFMTIGWGLAWGESDSSGFVGTTQFFLVGCKDIYAVMWNFSFAATASTIDSGAVAERMSFTAYLIVSTIVTGIIYPIVSHWVWHPEGWLAKRGYFDFAGSGAVHSLGGVLALVAAVWIGPRVGRLKPAPTEILASVDVKARVKMHDSQPGAGVRAEDEDEDEEGGGRGGGRGGKAGESINCASASAGATNTPPWWSPRGRMGSFHPWPSPRTGTCDPCYTRVMVSWWRY